MLQCGNLRLHTLIQPLLIDSSSVSAGAAAVQWKRKDSDDLERDKMKAQTLREEREATMDLQRRYKDVEAAKILKGV
jgi:hypothetical protein